MTRCQQVIPTIFVVGCVYKVMEPPFLSSVSVPNETQQSRACLVTLQGNWPTPNWQFQEVKINVDKNEMSVTITYLGKSSPGMALQVLKPFTDTVSIKFPSKGNWSLIFHHRGEDPIIKSVNVV